MHSTDRKLKFVGLLPTGDLAGLTCYTSRKRKVVWFEKSPPKKPATEYQRHQQLRFSAAAMAWKALTQGERNEFNQAATRGSLSITGYNLWIYWQLTRDRPVLRTLERQTNCTLLPR